ncbi:hypothetical protein [Candidatus Poriferisodalis sp.]|uniref:hypothetical protein n=1 Tax=Candidatus Poriferisodalis sp. TaxID=3101277 RepID=UPI003B023A72
MAREEANFERPAPEQQRKDRFRVLAWAGGLGFLLVVSAWLGWGRGEVAEPAPEVLSPFEQTLAEDPLEAAKAAYGYAGKTWGNGDLIGTVSHAHGATRAAFTGMMRDGLRGGFEWDEGDDVWRQALSLAGEALGKASWAELSAGMDLEDQAGAMALAEEAWWSSRAAGVAAVAAWDEANARKGASEDPEMRAAWARSAKAWAYASDSWSYVLELTEAQLNEATAAWWNEE